MSRVTPIGVSIALAAAEERYDRATRYCDHMHLEDDDIIDVGDSPCCKELFDAAKDLAAKRAAKRAEDHRL